MIVMEKKRITVSDKRQITIPIEFYNELNIGKQVDCVIEGNSIIIMPVSTENSYFAEEILKDLISQGYSGNELLTKFEEQRADIKKAICLLIEEADEIAAGKRKGASTKDIFGEE